jgi:hypothetical protein
MTHGVRLKCAIEVNFDPFYCRPFPVRDISAKRGTRRGGRKGKKSARISRHAAGRKRSKGRFQTGNEKTAQKIIFYHKMSAFCMDDTEIAFPRTGTAGRVSR